MSEENRQLKRLLSRQERELNKFVAAEADLPVILRAHNEEARVLKMKYKQVFYKFFLQNIFNILV